MHFDFDSWKGPRLQVYVASALTLVLIGGALGFIAGYGMKAYRGSASGVPITGSAPASLTSPVGVGGDTGPKLVWDVTEERSPIDDSPTVILSVGSDKPTVNRFGSGTSNRLIIRCKEHQTDAYIAMDEFLGSEGSQVITRVDDQPSETEVWSHSTDGKAVFAPKPIKLAQNLAKSQRLFARISDFQGTSYDVEFKLAGLSPILPKVARACFWEK